MPINFEASSDEPQLFVRFTITEPEFADKIIVRGIATINEETADFEFQYDSQNPILESLIIYHALDVGQCIIRKLGWRFGRLVWRRYRFLRDNGYGDNIFEGLQQTHAVLMRDMDNGTLGSELIDESMWPSLLNCAGGEIMGMMEHWRN